VLGTGSNLYDQYKNFKMTRPSEDARKGNYGIDPAHPRNLLNPKEGPVRADIARVFGDFATDPETRLTFIDQLNAAGGKSTDFVEQYKQLVADGKDPKKLFSEANRTPGAAMLEDYASFHESAQRTKASGGFKKYFGEDAHIAPGAGTANEGFVNKIVREHLAPSHMQGFTDLAEASNLNITNPHYNRELLKRMAEEYSPGAGAKAFAETGLRDLENPAFHNSGLSRFLRRAKLPIATGAAVAAGGAGMYALVKALQNQTHSKQKLNEWKKTILQARGDFDRARQYDTPAPRRIQQESSLPAASTELPEPPPTEALTQEQPTQEELAPAYQPVPQPEHTDDMDWSAALNSVR